ncbi:hypothetical protein L9F63_027210, partial [Diploptera punctata]
WCGLMWCRECYVRVVSYFVWCSLWLAVMWWCNCQLCHLYRVVWSYLCRESDVVRCRSYVVWCSAMGWIFMRLCRVCRV